MKCENCGIPDDAYSHRGYTMELAFRDELARHGRRNYVKRKVWVCGSECAVQTMAIAALGLPSHKWNMTLKEFTSQMKAAGKLDFLTRQKVWGQTRINSGVEEVDFENMGLPHTGGVSDAKMASKTGRPQVTNPSAGTRRQRRYEERKKLKGS